MNNNIFNQDGDFVKTLRPTRIMAKIYSPEQRKMVNLLIHHNFFPKHTAVGVGNCGRKKWSIEKYKGRHGVGFKMITHSPFSSNFNHLTYFVQYG